MRRVLLAAIACSVAAGCMTSPPAAKSPRIRTAEGIAAKLVLLSGDSVSGELLALDTAAVTLLAAPGIVAVRHEGVSEAHFAGYGKLTRDARGYLVERERWERIRLESRYPYGIPEPARAAIMGARNQARVDTLRAP
jgi:hypothetical protein